MLRKKRHVAAEIVAKLDQADELVAQGKTQNEIAQALDISVMTFHRWRKAWPHRLPTDIPALEVLNGGGNQPERHRLNRIAELEVENGRLRKLVTDLLLERMKLSDELRANPKLGGSKRDPT
jgi:transposase-like protein